MATHIATLHVGALLVSAVTTAALAGAGWRHREKPGATAFAGLMVAVTVWTTGYLVGLTVAPGGRYLWEPIQWFGIAFVPVFFIAFALDYLGYEESLRRVVGLASIPAVATLALVWTNHIHEQFWRDQEIVTTEGLEIVGQVAGPGYYAFIVYAYVLILAGSVLLGRLAVRSDYLYLDQSVLLLVGIVVPLLGNAFSVFGRTPIPGLDLTPYAFTITGLAFGNALFRYSLFERVPAARQLGRETVVGSLDDAVVIVDDERTVLYCNEEATDLFDVDAEAAIGDHVSAVVDVEGVDFEAPDALGELAVGGRTFEVRTSEITDRHDHLLGHTLVFNDITERKRRERTLERQRDELRLLDTLNAVVRDINGALIDANTRAAVSETVRERLAASDLYDAVWFLDEQALDAAELPAAPETDGGTTVEGDLATGESGLAVYTDEATIPVAGEETPDDKGVWTTVPLVYGRTVYGALVLFTERDEAFGERELAVLDELGESVGRAINAVETEQLLLSGAVVELELESPDGPLAGATAGTDRELSLDGLAPADDGLVAYCRVDAGDPDVVATALRDQSGVAEAEPSTEDPDLVECRLADESVVFPLRECGASFERVEAAGGRVEVAVEMAPETDVRTVVERVKQDLPEATLHAKRRREGPVDEAGALPADVMDGLTDRQQEALETAFRDGYFEWPRESNAEEVAESMDISSPTLHNHLRKAENKVLAEILDQE